PEALEVNPVAFDTSRVDGFPPRAKDLERFVVGLDIPGRERLVRGTSEGETVPGRVMEDSELVMEDALALAGIRQAHVEYARRNESRQELHDRNVRRVPEHAIDFACKGFVEAIVE